MERKQNNDYIFTPHPLTLIDLDVWERACYTLIQDASRTEVHLNVTSASLYPLEVKTTWFLKLPC